MKTFARVQNDLVAELFRTTGDLTGMFHPSLSWIDISERPEITEGWRFDGQSFAPPLIAPSQELQPTIGELQAQIAAIAIRLAALSSQQ